MLKRSFLLLALLASPAAFASEQCASPVYIHATLPMNMGQKYGMLLVNCDSAGSISDIEFLVKDYIEKENPYDALNNAKEALNNGSSIKGVEYISMSYQKFKGASDKNLMTLACNGGTPADCKQDKIVVGMYPIKDAFDPALGGSVVLKMPSGGCNGDKADPRDEETSRSCEDYVVAIRKDAATGNFSLRDHRNALVQMIDINVSVGNWGKPYVGQMLVKAPRSNQ